MLNKLWATVVIQLLCALAARHASAFTVASKISRVDNDAVLIQQYDGAVYRIELDIGCDYATKAAMKVGAVVLFYRNTTMSFAQSDPLVVDALSDNFSDRAALFLASTGSGYGTPNGKCTIASSAKVVNDSAGCCSSHGGIKGCTYGVVRCNDGMDSPSCTCQ